MSSRTWIVIALAAASSACRSSGAVEASGPPREVFTAMQGDERVHQDLELRAPRVQRDAGARAAEFDLANRTSHPLDVFYCVEWYDARNARIETLPQLWYPAHLDGGAIVHVRAAAPNAQAESFRLLAQRSSAFRR